MFLWGPAISVAHRSAFEALKRRGMMASRFRSSRVDAQGTTTGDDSALIELGRRFKEITALVQTLYDPAESDNRFEEIEATLARLEPIEWAIMTMPACTPTGLGVKARHAAYVISEYWNGSIDQIDWVVRLLIEAVCKAAQVPLPFPGAVGDAAPRKHRGSTQSTG